MRATLGLCGLYDLLARLPVFVSVYGGTPAAWPVGVDGAPRFGLLWGGHPEWFAWMVWTVAGLAVVTFALGYRTRISQLVLLAGLYTFDAPMFELTVCGASAVLRQVLVISVFLPLGAFWSLDWWRRGPKENEGRVYWSWVYPVLLLQLAVIYINTACAKFGPSWSLGTVFMDFLVLEGQVTELARWLRPLISLDVSRALTWGTLVFEILAPALLLLPFGGGRLRSSVAWCLMAFHLGICLLLSVGHFSAVMIAVLFEGARSEPQADWAVGCVQALHGDCHRVVGRRARLYK